MIPTISISIWLSALVCVSRTHLRKLTKRNNLDVFFFFMENINIYIYRKRYYNKPFNQCILHLQVIKKTIDDRENVQTNVHVYYIMYIYFCLFSLWTKYIYIYIYTYWNDDRSWSFHFINHMGFQTVENWEKKKTTFFSLHF